MEKKYDRGLAEELCGRINEILSGDSIGRPKDILSISTHVAQLLGFPVSGSQGGINCYPGTRTDKCYPLAFFWGIEDATHLLDGYLRRPRNLPTFKKALENLEKHMLEYCHVTKYAVVISDMYRDRHVKEHAATLKKIRMDGREVIFIMINGGACVDVTDLTF